MIANLALALALVATPAADAPDLAKTRAILAQPHEPYSEIAALGVKGYRSHLELDLGKGFRVVLVSRMLGGTLLLFGAEGRQVARHDTGEVGWLQVLDLDENGSSELILEEKNGWGTGILDRQYHVYSFGAGGIAEAWHGTSLWRNERETVRGYLRFEYSGGWYVLHVTEGGPLEGEAPRQAYQMRQAKLVPVPWPADR